MPLAMEGTRVLSPLERDTVKLVFQNAIDPWDISLTVVESIPREGHGLQDINPKIGNQFRPLSSIPRQAIIDLLKQKPTIEQQLPPKPLPQEIKPSLGEVASTYDGDGKIRINRSAFPHTQALNINSTRRYIDLTDKRGELTTPFSPGNMHYLSTLIHECTHYWQEVYGRHTFYKNFYDFTQDQLLKRDVPELSVNQHASAAQVYFLIAWQLEYRPKGSNVNLTSRSPNSEHNVGPVNRFRNIDASIHNSSKGASRIIKYEHIHNNIYNFFGWLLVELRHGWKAVCQGKESFTKNKRQAWVPTWAGYPS
ncbi:hypothetical protein F4X33_05585 [Candidatus Poribacteria bacterium]|nr:hypothetical protein [Candidatus Poribacteria bacterium]